MRGYIIGGVAAFALIASAGWAVGQYNGLQMRDEAVNTATSKVDNQYKRRADLIPQLVSTVEALGFQEKDLLIGVTQARASATQVKLDASTISDPEKMEQYQAAQQQVTVAMSALMRPLQEKYPEWK